MKKKIEKINVKLLSLVLATVLVMGLSFVPSISTADHVEENIAFVPNSGEASVSRVNLDTEEEIARYYTAPREDPNPSDWRTNRIALDSEGNAWVINTGADGSDLQGSIVRIQRDTEGLDTNEDPDNPMDFGEDEAVEKFEVGEPGDMPRAIAFDDDGYIWVGFYQGGQLSQYEYEDGELEYMDSWSPEDLHIGYYNIEFGPDGILFISSRDSEPSVDPDTGIYSFDGEDFDRETTFDPYFLLISDDGDVYASSYTGGYIWDRQEDETIDVTVDDDYTEAHRGMAFDDNGRIWIASTDEHSGGDRVYWLDLETEDTGYITVDTDYGTTPIGVGTDAHGNMWTVLRSDNWDEGFIQAFDPETGEFVGAVEVGNRPYAYADIVVEEITYEISGYKYMAEWEDDEWTAGEGLEGWTINLEQEIEGEWQVIETTETDEDGMYNFTDLEAGEYRVSEQLQDGWVQVYPEEDYHEVTLPNGEDEEYNFLNRHDEQPLTPGYWKTHSEYGPAGYDETWDMIEDDAEDTEFFLSEQSYIEVLWTPPQGGNAYYILAHSYIAAELNFYNGVDPSPVEDEFDEATDLFEEYTPDDVGSWRGNQGERGYFLDLAETLDDYNNGEYFEY